jgi:hypothetical protein
MVRVHISDLSGTEFDGGNTGGGRLLRAQLWRGLFWVLFEHYVGVLGSHRHTSRRFPTVWLGFMDDTLLFVTGMGVAEYQGAGNIREFVLGWRVGLGICWY